MNWTKDRTADLDKKDTGLRFTDVLFGFVFKEIFFRLADWNSIDGDGAPIVKAHLVLAAVVTMSSYVGFRKSLSRADYKLKFFNLPMIRFVVVEATTSSLVTYLNPNLGFDGTPYRASGWTLVGMETLDSYAYVDGRYRSQRQIAEDRIPEEDVTRSVMALQPLHIYARGIDSPDSPARLFPSPSLRPGAET